MTDPQNTPPTTAQIHEDNARLAHKLAQHEESVQLGTSDYPCCFVRPYAAALARTDQKLKECEEDSVQLDAWQFAFGTTQLTHAIARLEKAVANRDRLARENEELRTIVVQFDACINDLIEDRDTADMIVKARNTQYFHRKIVAALAGGKGERK